MRVLDLPGKIPLVHLELGNRFVDLHDLLRDGISREVIAFKLAQILHRIEAADQLREAQEGLLERLFSVLALVHRGKGFLVELAFLLLWQRILAGLNSVVFFGGGVPLGRKLLDMRAQMLRV